MATSLSTRYTPTADMKKACLDPEVNPVSIGAILDTVTGKEWHDWEPEMLRDFLDIPAAAQQPLDKVMAVQVAITNPDVFTDWDLFSHVCTAFNHRRCSFEWLDRPSLMELAWACVCLRQLNGSEQFGPGVERFIAARLLEEGLTFFPWTGGEGLHLCRDPYKGMVRGIVDEDLCRIGDEIKERWDRNEIQDLEPSEIDDRNPIHVQLSMVVACQAYIRAQKPRELTHE